IDEIYTFLSLILMLKFIGYNSTTIQQIKEDKMDAITTQQASQDLDNLVDRVIADVEPTTICNNKGNKAILISLEEFSSWQETLYLLSNPVNAKHLLSSIQSAKAGDIIERDLIEE
ncbi:MAG: type II toxin-antitoxin system Phd/YefM family antitoxin, partial [Sphaerospermopsis kisseleviana]